MTDLSAKILSDFQARKTAKQKDRFIELLKAEFPELTVSEKKKTLMKNRNLILGDVKNADVILSAHYDTCAVLPFPNLIFANNVIATVAAILPVVIVMIALCAGAMAAVVKLGGGRTLGMGAYFAVLFAFVIVTYAGKPSTHTANDNTSGVITLIETYARLSVEEKAKTAVVFFDNEEYGLVGSRIFLKENKKLLDNKLLINFDCVSDGDNILFICSKKAYEDGQSLSQCFKTDEKKIVVRKAANSVFPSDQKDFPRAIGVASMHHNVFGYYMPRLHTRRDVIFDEKNIEYLAGALCAFVGEKE